MSLIFLIVSLVSLVIANWIAWKQRQKPERNANNFFDILDHDLVFPFPAAVLAKTGFRMCEFGPDEQPCDSCDSRHVQLFFGNSDYWDSREGDYFCLICMLNLADANRQSIQNESRLPDYPESELPPAKRPE